MTYDVLVLGAGGVGAAALYHQAPRGVRALAIDRFPPGHDRGSSHGDTRIIRQAYFEHSDYVPLALRSYALWTELEARRGERLFHQAGLLQIGPPEGPVVRGVLESAARHGLDVERLDAPAIAARFPGHRTPDGMCGVFERKAGYLRVEACVIAHAEAARQLGAELAIGEAATGWRATESGVEVTTDRGKYSAARLILTAGAWAPGLLAELGIRFEVRRKPLFWFATEGPLHRVEEGAPTFLYEMPQGIFYGFPQVDGHGVKVAEHTGGEPVADPLVVDRALRPGEERRVADFVGRQLAGVTTRLVRHAVCMYTMSPDEHFVVDRHPKHPQVVFAAGLSGHGFKFTSALGEALVEMSLDGRTTSPVEFLGCGRAGLR
jgi:sarcosine oxidase